MQVSLDGQYRWEALEEYGPGESRNKGQQFDNVQLALGIVPLQVGYETTNLVHFFLCSTRQNVEILE